jgi:hypothetical protein
VSNPLLHAESSARKHGGVWEDYIDLHNWFDQTKAHVPDVRHRAILHSSFGIFLCEQMFSEAWTVKSTGRVIPTRTLAEQHVMEDFGGKIPTMGDWLDEMKIQPWMGRAARELSKELPMYDDRIVQETNETNRS